MRIIGLDEIHDILYSILCDVDEFCRREGIHYSIGYGTLLGAVRYGDFIPWDDDVDIIMPRPDFDRFVSTYKGKYECLLNTRRDDVHYVSGYAKVHDSGTDKYVDRRKSFYSRYGVSVDVFPMDPVPDDDAACTALMKKVSHIHRRLAYRSRKSGSPMLLLYSRLHSTDWWWKKLNTTLRSCKAEECSRIAVMVGPESARNIQAKDFFGNLKEIRLREHSFPCPGNIEAYLTQLYGPTFMTPPPENERTGHGCVVYQIS